MKLICERDALSRALHHVIGRARNKTKIPILSHVLLTAKGRVLHLAATDQVIRCEASCAADIASEGAVAVPADRLHGLIDGFPKGSQVAFSFVDADLRITCGRSNYRLLTLPASDFPQADAPRDPVEFALGCVDVKALFSEPVPAITITGARIFMEGGRLYQPRAGEIAMIGADGVRLVRRALPAGVTFDGGYTVPKATMSEIVRLATDGEVSLRCAANLIEVSVGSFVLTSKLLDGDYPNLDRVITPRQKQFILIDRAELVGAIRRLMGLSAEYSLLDIVWGDDGQTLELSLVGEGSGSETVACNYDLPPGQLCFAPSVLVQMLDAFKAETIQLHIAGPIEPVRIIDPNDDGLLVQAMPCRPRNVAQSSTEAA